MFRKQMGYLVKVAEKKRVKDLYVKFEVKVSAFLIVSGVELDKWSVAGLHRYYELVCYCRENNSETSSRLRQEAKRRDHVRLINSRYASAHTFRNSSGS